MNHWRNIASRILANCRQKLSKKHFQLINIILIFGGINYRNISNRWTRVLCPLSKGLAIVHSILVIMCFIENFQLRDNHYALYFTVIQIFFVSGFIREYFMRKYSNYLDRVKKFLNSEQITSNDEHHDSNIRRKFHRKTIVTSLILLANLVICELSAPILMLQENKYYRIPQLLLSVGPTWSTLIQWIYIMTIFPLWTSKAFGPTILITAIMSGLETEYTIMVHGFGSFVERVRSDLDGRAIFNVKDNKIFWNLLKEQINFHFDQHILLTENIMKIQLIIRYLYCAIHYSAMILVAVGIYLVLLDDTLTGGLISAMAAIFFTLECIWWCSVADAFPDINTTLEEYIADLALAIPYHRRHHSDYVQLRTTLMVFKMNARNSALFSCARIFQLSKASYLQILQKSYALFTFLLNIGLSNPK
ncbi:AAEL017125-PA [Aedes aegypti]|uniref:AAEL017125-PA n=2 Tax=Aedes aegypti TaxID=7159 RepID=A0A1S7UEG8_AEDAE|nr:AAEL017125-PA [Aedes aegypti]DAA80421.1 TPA_exp: odorant receptor 89 [Aedes aegypti]